MLDLQARVDAKLTEELAVKDTEIAALNAIIESLAPDEAPDAFTFTPATDVALGATVISNEITVTGINQAVVVTSTVPRSKNGGPFTTLDGVAKVGDKFRLQLKASDTSLTTLSGNITIGSGSPVTFSVTTGDFLTPFSLFPQQIHRAWLQEDLVDGNVSSWLCRGRAPIAATQGTVANQPSKLPNNGGVFFNKNSTKWLQWGTDSETPYSHRWWLVIAKANLAGSTVGSTIVAINGVGGGQGLRQPLVSFTAPNTMSSSVFDTALRFQNGVADAGWNVLLGFRRGANYQAVVNGVKNAPVNFSGFRPNNVSSLSQFGHSMTAVAPYDEWIDCALFGDGELTDKQIDILVGWAHWRVGRQDLLPVDHPFKNRTPKSTDISSADFHKVHEYNPTAWATFAAAANNSARYAHRGQATYSEAGYKRVFFTDFDRVDQYPVSDLLGPKGSPWYAPGHVTNLGGQASILQGNGQFWPTAYVQDLGPDAGGSGRPGTLAIRIHFDQNIWKTGAMYSVNNNGYGRYWGKGIFKARTKFPALTPPLPGLFPSPLWSYGAEHIFQRTRNRLEPDFVELTGKGFGWAEGNTHVHKGRYPFLSDPTILTGSDLNAEVYAYTPNTTNGFPEIFNFCDGQFHDWICKIDDDWTYYYLSLSGVPYELCRVPTVPEISLMKYLIFNMQYDRGHGDRDALTTEQFDMTVDFIEVLQKETDLLTIPAGFTTLPTLSGTLAAGQTLTVTPNTTASQIEYLWYRDGVPIVSTVTDSYTLTTMDSGHRIRVHVKAKSLVNQPEAWTLESDIIS